MASARYLVGILAAVVLAFLAATAASQYVESRSATQLDAIIGNAMPSVQLISLVRGDLRRIDLDLDQARTGAEIAEERRNIDAALAAYRALPFFPAEFAMYSSVPDLLHKLDAQVAASQVEPARKTLDALDRELERIVTYDASQGQRLGLEIASARSESRVLVWLLDAASVLLAFGAMILAIRQRRGAIRVVEDEDRAARDRMAELATKVDELGHFAGRVAHDIRGPLQAAKLSLELVRAQAEGMQRIVPAVQRGSAALARVATLVDGLLDFARAGGKPAEGAVACVGEVISDVIDGVAAEASAASVALHVAPVSDARVQCSAGVLTSIVSNLVRNAIRHMGDAAERRVDVTVRDAGERWRIEVQDSGPGIPPGQEHRIFDPYVQLAPGKGGIGLGLATVDRLVRAHDGALGVDSPPGHGAVFWFELPRASDGA